MALHIESKSGRFDIANLVPDIGLATQSEVDVTRLGRAALPIAAVAMAPIGPILLRGSPGAALLAEFLLLGVALGAVAAAVVLAPVPHSRGGRAELGLRVVTTVSVLTAIMVAAAALAAPHAFSVHGAKLSLCWCWAAVVLTPFAVASWYTGPSAPADRPIPPLCALLKRWLDIVLATTALVLTLPVLAAAAIAIVCESKGGWLFTQTRLGERGRPFRFYKLRTMVDGNDDSEHRAHMVALISGEPVLAELY